MSASVTYAALHAEHLSKSFAGIAVVRDVSFSLAQGDVLGLIGCNGAGKTTTMRMLTGFIPPDIGEVEVFGQSLRRNPHAVRTLIGYVPEGAPLYDEMTVYEFLYFIAAARGVPVYRRQAALFSAVDKADLHEVLERRIELLSKGLRRRVALAQALVHNPPILILDEPTDGLDPNQKQSVRTLIRAMATDKAILISTHALDEVAAVCTRVVLLSKGSIAYQGSVTGMIMAAGIDEAVRVRLAGQGALRLRGALGARGGLNFIEEAGYIKVTSPSRTAEELLALVRQAAEGLDIIELCLVPPDYDDAFARLTEGKRIHA
jgi:ABC-2 type transport system ATP-binding protein